ncbi:2-oxo acid dehydrogenase subunit E2 [Sulfitobacter sp. JBTF-M27]|uniref:Dihydrolipoamide acetyltransferase component of pyruvate dehydrogenase complex n=1 Tax=Sulfitobacter sediminilitoris TaxID=2698830 RepID=A0A6P0CI04_9RHOB|nr:dihydrolipoamide acetyltransferase family protein [Sulfitobacter sediminilitoris]NEK25030.1 2-oxo acid dehydrogenase subunit E2 [Sulfitobacter sediminilitoris]
MTVFTLPDLGEGLQEAEIVAWHVSQGDHVITDQPLVSVETDKAVVEVPTPFSGTVERIIASEGDVVAIGAPLVDIATGVAEDKGAIVGELGDGAKDASPADTPAADSPSPAPAGAGATPAVRQLAREKGVDLATLTGSGPGGAILSSDVLAAQAGSVTGDALRGVRRSMARAMARSRDTVVPATVTDRAVIHRWPAAENPTLRLVQAIAAACSAEPALNVWFDGKTRQLHSHLDLAIAVDTSDGLFAPVLRKVDIQTDLAARIADLKAAVKARSIQPEALRGATFTLSNFGMLGGERASLVVTPPQVAILGAGRIEEACLAEDGKPVVRRVLPLSLTFDHRVVTGGEAARFLSAVRADLERPTHHAKD